MMIKMMIAIYLVIGWFIGVYGVIRLRKTLIAGGGSKPSQLFLFVMEWFFTLIWPYCLLYMGFNYCKAALGARKSE